MNEDNIALIESRKNGTSSSCVRKRKRKRRECYVALHSTNPPQDIYCRVHEINFIERACDKRRKLGIYEELTAEEDRENQRTEKS